MIGRLKGEVVHREKDSLVVDVQGVGYLVSVAHDIAETLGKPVGKTVELWTYLAVREDALDLYGFSDRESLHFFELLLSVSGIGPKSALGILNVAPLKTLQSAIASGDASHLTKTTGIGTKKAEKIILELRDKLEVLGSDRALHQEAEDVIDALVALGYARREVQEALKKLPQVFSSTEVKIKEALKLLGK